MTVDPLRWIDPVRFVDLARLVELLAPYAVAAMLLPSVVVLGIMVAVRPRTAVQWAFAVERVVLVVLLARLLEPLLPWAPGWPLPAWVDLLVVAAMVAAGAWLAVALIVEWWAPPRARREDGLG